MSDVEVWESTTESGLWLQVKDPINGGWKALRVAGRDQPGARFQITTIERKFNQDRIPLHNRHLDPFTNGHLVCVEGRPTGEQRAPYELHDEDLMKILQIADESVFAEAIEDIGIELPLRRLAALAEKHATLDRYNKVRDVIDSRYRVGGTQRTVAEAIAAGERIALST